MSSYFWAFIKCNHEIWDSTESQFLEHIQLPCREGKGRKQKQNKPIQNRDANRGLFVVDTLKRVQQKEKQKWKEVLQPTDAVDASESAFPADILYMPQTN